MSAQARVVTATLLSDGLTLDLRLSCGHQLVQRGKFRWFGGGWWLRVPVRRVCPICWPWEDEEGGEAERPGTNPGD